MGGGCIDPRFLDFSTSRGWVVIFTPLSLYTRGKTASTTYWIGGWMGPRSSLDDTEKGKFLTLPGLELYSSVAQPIARQYTDCAFPNKLLHAFLISHTCCLSYPPQASSFGGPSKSSRIHTYYEVHLYAVLCVIFPCVHKFPSKCC
jgi:hypothetical protein